MKELKLSQLEVSELIAISIKPLILAVDFSLNNLREAGVTLEQLKETRTKMEISNSPLGALPFFETMRKADVLQAQTNVLTKMIELLEMRKQQIELESQSDETVGASVLKQLGY